MKKFLEENKGLIIGILSALLPLIGGGRVRGASALPSAPRPGAEIMKKLLLLAMLLFVGCSFKTPIPGTNGICNLTVSCDELNAAQGIDSLLRTKRMLPSAASLSGWELTNWPIDTTERRIWLLRMYQEYNRKK
jgi:hypothetical protein